MSGKSDYVNVFMGTTGSGMAIVGPQMPHGMVKVAPQTVSLPNAGYNYADDTVLGFAHTHVEGIGGTGGRGNLMLMPSTGEFIADERLRACRFSHEDERAEVGYYSVLLRRYGVKVEISAARCCAIYRLTYPRSDESRLSLDMGHTLHTAQSGLDCRVEAASRSELRGWGLYPLGHPRSNHMKIYFCLRLSKPAERVAFWRGGERIDGAASVSGAKAGAAFEFSTAEGEVVFARLGISYISEEQAAKNLDAQLPGCDFDGTVAACKAAWDEKLSAVDIVGSDERTRIFYSDMYRALNAPVDYTEEGGVFFNGADGEPHTRPTNGRRYYSDMWAIWDTFRSTHPFQQLVDPSIQDDVAWSLMENYFVSGMLPNAPAPCFGLVPCMTGHHASSVIAESLAKGHGDFDRESAYAALREATTRTDIGGLGIPESYARLGYIPAEEDSPESDHTVSTTLELSYDDWCAGELARLTGHDEDAGFFAKRAKNYANVFDPQAGFVRRRRADGSFIDPFDPDITHKRGFCECSPWEYTSLVPHDIQGVINLMGGDDEMAAHIDGTFSHNRFNHINETAFHIPFIYNFARKPWKTMECCRRYMTSVHSLAPGGLYGEDDSGAMSAWFAFIALGLFSSCPARPCYSLTSPAFERWSLRLPSGKAFTVVAEGNSEENIYIQKAFLNGEEYDKSYLNHADIFAGGELRLVMGDTPSDWATSFASAPPSLTTERPRFEITSVGCPSEVEACRPASLRIGLRNSGADGSFIALITENGAVRGRAVCTLASGAEGEFEIGFKLYDADTREILVGGERVRVHVLSPIPARLVFGATAADRLFVSESDLEQGFRLHCPVTNAGSFTVTESVPCLLDGSLAGVKTVSLGAGESDELCFDVRPFGRGSHSARIGGGKAVQLDVAALPDTAKYRLWRGCEADFAQAGDSLYINAAGQQHQYPCVSSNRTDYGIIWLRFPVKGDFDASVRVDYEGYTTPYAMHGIICKNNTEKVQADAGGMIMSGAMSSRGFVVRPYTDFGLLDKGSRPSFLGDPKAPYSFLLKRRGNHYDSYFKKDGEAWVWQCGCTIESAAGEQYLGLFVNSCVPDKRLVKFSGFTVVEVRL